MCRLCDSNQGNHQKNIMENLNKKIVTLIPSATEIVSFLGEKNSIMETIPWD